MRIGGGGVLWVSGCVQSIRGLPGPGSGRPERLENVGGEAIKCCRRGPGGLWAAVPTHRGVQRTRLAMQDSSAAGQHGGPALPACR